MNFGVMHLIDSLEAGGAESVAVNLVNFLPRGIYEFHLVTSRRDGTLAKKILPDVRTSSLERLQTFDIKALSDLIEYNNLNRIKLLHAHSTSLFIATLASFFPPFPKVIWHVHSGAFSSNRRKILPYYFLARKIDGIIAVNQHLANWFKENFHFSSSKIWFVPNFSILAQASSTIDDLPGCCGYRIVCLANLRPEKDHITLLHALDNVASTFPQAHLLLVGKVTHPLVFEKVKREINILGLNKNVTFLGHRTDVPEILNSCDIGILSSYSEGFPLALVEYGLSGLPAIVTSVGECPEIVDHGRVGLLVPPGNPEKLAFAMLDLLNSPEERFLLGQRFKNYIQNNYDSDVAVSKILKIYNIILTGLS